MKRSPSTARRGALAIACTLLAVGFSKTSTSAPAAPDFVGPVEPASMASPSTGRVQLHPAFLLNVHAPSGPMNNINGGPEVESNASVASDGAGHWVAVWHSMDDSAQQRVRDYDILVSRSNDDGGTWSTPVALNGNAAGDTGSDIQPFVMTDRNGTWLVAWDSDETLGGRYGLDRDIFFSRSSDNGATWSAPAPLNRNAARDYGRDVTIRLGSDGAEGWVAVWSSTDSLGNTIGGDSDILVAHSTDKGETWSEPAALSATAAGDRGFDTSPDVASGGRGRWVAVWAAGDSALRDVGSDGDVLFTHSDDNGATWSEAATLNSNAKLDKNSDWSPRVATDGQGGWLAVWSSSDSLRGTIGVDRDILVARSTDNGSSWSNARALSRDAANDAGEDSAPAIVNDGRGTWIVAWQAWGDLGGPSGSDSDIAMAYSSDEGATWSETLRVRDSSAGRGVDDMLPSLATDARGHCVTVWQSFNPADLTAKASEWRVLVASATIAPLANGAASSAPEKPGSALVAPQAAVPRPAAAQPPALHTAVPQAAAPQPVAVPSPPSAAPPAVPQSAR
jgi:predicted neuraminidase